MDDVSLRGLGCELGFTEAFGDSAVPVKKDNEVNQPVEVELPLSLPEFLKKDIPRTEYWIEGVLQKQGRGMVSAFFNVGKSFFLQNVAVAIASGIPAQFLDKFIVKQGRVLYLDLEMGESSLKERFMHIANGLDSQNLFVKYLPSLNLLDSAEQALIEGWLELLKPEVLIIDPLCGCWGGDENNAQEVTKLTSYFDSLRDKFQVALFISHHWKKPSKDAKRGALMASGSYRWSAWLDTHFTLEGNPDALTLSCEKSRNQPRLEPFMIRLNESLRLEFSGEFKTKFTEQTLIGLFSSFNSEKVAVSDLCKKALQEKICSEDTLRGLIKASKVFGVDKSQKKHIIYRISENGVVG